MELSDLSEMPWMAEYKECLILLSEIDALRNLLDNKNRISE